MSHPAKLEQLPALANIEFIREDDYPLDVEVQDDDGNPIDFSNWSNERLEVHQTQRNGGAKLDEYTVSGNLTTTAGGRIQVTFPSGDNSAWDEYNVYEVEGTDGDGNNRSILKGQIHVVDQISGS